MTSVKITADQDARAALALFKHLLCKHQIRLPRLPWLNLTQPSEVQSQLSLAATAETGLHDSTPLLTQKRWLITHWTISGTQACIMTQSSPSRFLGATPLSCTRTMDFNQTSWVSMDSLMLIAMQWCASILMRKALAILPAPWKSFVLVMEDLPEEDGRKFDPRRKASTTSTTLVCIKNHHIVRRLKNNYLTAWTYPWRSVWNLLEMTSLHNFLRAPRRSSLRIHRSPWNMTTV